MRQIMKAADPVGYRHSVDRITRLLGREEVCDMSLEDLFTVLHTKLHSQNEKFNLEEESLVHYLTVTVDEYLERRSRIFLLLGKTTDESRPEGTSASEEE